MSSDSRMRRAVSAGSSSTGYEPKSGSAFTAALASTPAAPSAAATPGAAVAAAAEEEEEEEAEEGAAEDDDDDEAGATGEGVAEGAAVGWLGVEVLNARLEVLGRALLRRMARVIAAVARALDRMCSIRGSGGLRFFVFCVFVLFFLLR